VTLDDATAASWSDDDERRRVLAALLAAVDPDADTAADRLLRRFGSIAAIGSASFAQLAALVGPASARLLAAHREAMLVALREPAVRGPLLATRHDLVEYLHHRMAPAAIEELRVFFLNRRRELIAEEVIARGGPDGLLAEPRPVVVRALELGATGLLLVHNHPSGDPTPSRADARFTRALVTAGACLGIRLHDHLVIARDGHALVEVGSTEQLLRS